MITIEIAVPFLGRQFKILTITKKENIMAAEQKLVKVKITNAVGIGYAKGKVYEVTPEEASRLIENQKAIAVLDEKETSDSKKAANAEKR